MPAAGGECRVADGMPGAATRGAPGRTRQSRAERSCLGTVREQSGNYPGAVPELSGGCPGAVPELSAEPVLKAGEASTNAAAGEEARGTSTGPEVGNGMARGVRCPWSDRGKEELLGRGGKGKSFGGWCKEGTLGQPLQRGKPLDK